MRMLAMIPVRRGERRGITKVLAAVLLALSFTSTPAHTEAMMPDELARKTSDKILALLKANQEAYKKDQQKLYDMVYEQVLPHFDFRAMSKLVLGRYWREATQEQRQRFADEFRDLLVRTYATALLKFTDEEIVFLPFTGRPDDRTVVVKTEVRRLDGGPSVPINYNFYHKNAEWKIYDVTIEGVSLVTNYRNVYAEKIRKEGIDALIAGMAASVTSEHAPKVRVSN